MLSDDDQDGIPATVWVLNTFPGVRIRHPLSVHHEKIFVTAGDSRQVAHPSAIAFARERGPGRIPTVKGTRHEYAFGFRLDEFQVGLGRASPGRAGLGRRSGCRLGPRFVDLRLDLCGRD
jgi:hypothetical protein